MSAYRQNARVELEETPEEWLARVCEEQRGIIRGVILGGIFIAYELMLFFV